MTPPPDPHLDERPLRALFDRTAEQATSAQLTKLAARAADVPARARRFAWPAWALGPALAAAAAVILLFAWPRTSPEGAGLVAATPREPLVSPSVALTAGTPALGLPEYEDVFPVAATAMFTGESDDYDPLGGSLDVSPSDADLDAWLAAADEILGGG